MRTIRETVYIPDNKSIEKFIWKSVYKSFKFHYAFLEISGMNSVWHSVWSCVGDPVNISAWNGIGELARKKTK